MISNTMYTFIYIASSGDRCLCSWKIRYETAHRVRLNCVLRGKLTLAFHARGLIVRDASR